MLGYGPYIGNVHGAPRDNWEKLAAERRPDRAWVLLVPVELQRRFVPNFDSTTFVDDDREIPNRLTEWIHEEKFEVKLKKGDVVHLPCGGYRNDGSYFWNGEKVIDFEFTVDEYGAVPQEWTFPEFPINYFDMVVAHNSYVWIDSQFNEEIAANTTFGIPDIVENAPGKIMYSWFIYSEEKYWIIGEADFSEETSEEEHRKIFADTKMELYANFYDFKLPDDVRVLWKYYG